MLKKLCSIKNCNFMSACKGCNLAFTIGQLSNYLLKCFCFLELVMN
jgi:hypothetical protein